MPNAFILMYYVLCYASAFEPYIDLISVFPISCVCFMIICLKFIGFSGFFYLVDMRIMLWFYAKTLSFQYVNS